MGNYLAKIIANDQEGLQMISACSSGAKVKVTDIKYLASNKVFLLSITRTKIEKGQKDKKINSICRFDFVDRVKSKNINQKNDKLVLELIAIDYLKNKEDYEINLIFNNNSYITLTTETIEVRLEDQNEIKDNKVFVKGNITFAAAELMATDLRASVSLILAALTAKGRSVINRIYHLDRGYEGIEKKLKKVGAKIRRIN